MSTFDLDGYLRSEAARVEQQLELALARIAGDATARLRAAMAYSLLGGGKRFRPILVSASATALKREPSNAELDFACALEMIHTYSLIHDDLPAMDDDDLRRGRPTNHIVHGEALAILAGDALLTDAFGLLASGAAEAPQRLALCAELAIAAGSTGMVGGQVDDVAGESDSLPVLQAVHARKTGALIRAACRGPALLEAPAHLAMLTQYGERLGVAFQIADDILDAEGSASAAGKQVGKDAAKGRVSYPQLLGLEGAKRAADDAADAAIAALAELPGDKEALTAIARYTVHRDR